MLSFAEKRDWLRLTRTPTIGPVAFNTLLQRFGSPSEALHQLPSLIRKKNISPPSQHQVEAEMEASDALGIKLIASCESDYPKYLRALDPGPPIISVWGRSDILNKPCIAIVGSRNASAIGQRFASQIARELGQKGYMIVSGLARGIDTAAHQASIATGTVGVLGGGVDHVYPRQNTDLFNAMRENGALVSESHLGYRATSRDFPRRNRIISGLSMGVVVIEAADRSGTLITARYALEQNRDVMAAPGSPLDPRTKGCNRLIQQGAALIESSEDIINVVESSNLRIDVKEGKETYNSSIDWASLNKDIESAKRKLLSLLSPTPTPRDEIIRYSQLPANIVIAALLELELNGEVFVEPDGKVAAL